MKKIDGLMHRQVLTFTKRPNGSIFISGYPPVRFFISRTLLISNQFLVEPLTLTRFVKSFLVNLFHVNYWKLL